MIGRIIEVGVGKETTRGTIVVPGMWVPKYEATVRDKREYINDDQSMGIIADSDDARIMKEFSEGEISGKVRDQSFGFFLLSALGSVSSAVAGGETVVYDHTFNMQNDNSHQSLTVEMKDDNEQMAYPLSIINSLKLNAELGKFVEFTAGFIGKKGTSASNSPSYTAENEFVPQDMVIKFATTMAGLGAASAISLKKVELSVEKNPEQRQYLGSVEPDGSYNKVMKLEANIETLFTDTTLKGYFTAGTPMAMRIEMIDSNTTIGTASNPTLTIDLPRVTFPEWEVSGANDEIVSQTTKIKGHYSVSDSKFIQAVLTNLKVSY